MKLSTAYSLIALLSLVAIAPAGAEQVYTMDEMTVEAEKVETQVKVTAESTTEDVPIDQKKKPVVSTVPDVLDQTVGIDVQRRSVLAPKNSQVRLRGLDESRYNVMLDGRLLNGTGVMGGYYVDWSMVPLLDWDDVDVGKGAYSAKHGNTLGGTINLVPKRPVEGVQGSVSAGYERYNTVATDNYATVRHGPFGGVVTAGFASTDGNLRNSEAERQNYSGTIYYYPGGDGELRASFRYVDGDFNLPVENRPGMPNYDSDYPVCSGDMLAGPGIRFPSGDTYGDGSYYIKKRYETEIAYRQTVFGFNAEAILYYNHEDRTDHITSYDTGEEVLVRESSPDISWGWSTRFKKALGAHLIGFGGQGHYEGYDGTENTYIKEGYFPSPITDGSDDRDASKWHGVYLDDTWQLFDNLDLYAGLRLDNYIANRKVEAVSSYEDGKPTGYEEVHAKLDDTTVLPKFGAVFQPIDSVSLFGRVARATRFPTSPEFYWYYGGYRPEVDPNSDIRRKDLTYEDALQFELGLSFQPLNRLTLLLTYYNYHIDNYIRTIFGYSPSRIVYNLDEARLQGVELAAEGRIWGDVYAFANFTFQQTRKYGDVFDGSNTLSNELSELPEFKVNWGVKYQREDGAMASLNFRYVGATDVPIVNDDNSASGAPVGSAVELKHLGDFFTLDLLFKYPVIKYSVCGQPMVGMLSAGVTNLFDKYYVEEYYFPAPGRSFNVGFQLKF